MPMASPRSAMYSDSHGSSRYTFAPATSARDLTEIHHLNHEVFASEIGQHHTTSNRLLVDQFDQKNTYFVAKREGSIVGMVAVHDQPPFSAASKLDNPSVLEALGSKLLEVRLLAVHPEQRNSTVLAGLLYSVLLHAYQGKHEHLLISGVDQQLPMYQRLGFRPIGPPVIRGKAKFTPMAVAVKQISETSVKRFQRWATNGNPVSLLPGPVQIGKFVREAYASVPVSHRCADFVSSFEQVRERLGQLAGGMGVGLFPGSGTLANDVVGAALAADPSRRKGLILANGEFGERLSRHATRWRLAHEVLTAEWGQPWDLDQIEHALATHPDINWIWAVQLETSTGMVNDLAGLKQVARQHGADIYLDCVSGFGAMELDLAGIALASTVSGKSLGSYAGVSIVLTSPEVAARLDSANFPVSFDLPAALRARGPATTFASPVIYALQSALEQQGPEKWNSYAAIGHFVRRSLAEHGYEPLVTGPDAAPIITTFRPKPDSPAALTLTRCALGGYRVAGESDYLLKRGWLQIATMGDISEAEVAPVFEML